MAILACLQIAAGYVRMHRSTRRPLAAAVRTSGDVESASDGVVASPRPIQREQK
jgi:hypothetical protein